MRIEVKPPNFREDLFHALGSIRISALRIPEASSSTLDTVWRVKTVKPALVLCLPVGEDEMNIAIR
jgi:hypothetical protein